MKTTWVELDRSAFTEMDFRRPVLALHGATSTGRQWHGLADYLRSRYRVIAPDLPGYADPEAARCMIEAMLDQPAHVVGHLHGAAVALDIAMSRPDLVRSLTLIEPTTFHLLRRGDPGDLALFAELADLAKEMNAAVRCDDPVAGMHAYVDFCYGHDAWQRTSPALRRKLARQLSQVASYLSASLHQSWPADRLAQLKCPTLAVMALESPTASLRATEMTAQAIPGARLVMLADAGHMAPLTDPHIVDPLIGNHLKAIDRSAMSPSTKRPVRFKHSISTVPA